MWRRKFGVFARHERRESTECVAAGMRVSDDDRPSDAGGFACAGFTHEMTMPGRAPLHIASPRLPAAPAPIRKVRDQQRLAVAR